MKCPSATNWLLALAFIAPAVPFSAAQAAITRTQVGIYDLAAGKSHIYNLNVTPTPDGGTLTLSRSGDGSTQLSAYITPCARPEGGTSGRALVKMKEDKGADIDPELVPFIQYAGSNNLRISLKSLSDTRQIVLFEDSDTLMVDEKTLPHSDAAKCQQD